MRANHPKGRLGNIGQKNGEKLPIVHHCRLDLTRSVRRDACSNFLLPGREESAERANAKKDGTSLRSAGSSSASMATTSGRPNRSNRGFGPAKSALCVP